MSGEELNDSKPRIVPRDSNASSASHQGKPLSWAVLENFFIDMEDDHFYKFINSRRVLSFNDRSNGTVEINYDESTGKLTLASSASSDEALDQMIDLLAEKQKLTGEKSPITLNAANERAWNRMTARCHERGLTVSQASKPPEPQQMKRHGQPHGESQEAAALAQRRRHAPPPAPAKKS